MRILFGLRSDGADSFFRGYGPASMLRYQGVEVQVGIADPGAAKEYDILVLNRHCTAEAEVVAKAFQRAGKVVVYDVDDWLFGMPPYWPAYGQYFHRGRSEPTSLLSMHQRMIELAEVVTCTTEVLREKLVGLNPFVEVVPNCVLGGDWDTVPRPGSEVEGPVVGWFGLPYYWDSWREIHEAVEEAVLAVGGWLCVLGYPEVVEMFSKRLRERTLVQPMVPWSEFRQFRRLIKSWEVGLAWVRDTPFNRCKSPLRALQLGMAGVPVVASQCVYGEVLSGEYPSEYGLVVGDVSELSHAIVRCVEDRESARLRAEKWHTRVWQAHCLESQWVRWLEVYEGAALWTKRD